MFSIIVAGIEDYTMPENAANITLIILSIELILPLIVLRLYTIIL